MRLSSSSLLAAILALASPAGFAASQAGQEAALDGVSLSHPGALTRITLASGALVRSTDQQVDGLRALHVPGSSAIVLIWSEVDDQGGRIPWYAISLDGRTVARALAASYAIQLERASFDPLAELPDFSLSPLDWDGEVYLVQFHTQVLGEYRAALEDLGVRVYDHLVNATLIARMTPAVRARVEALDVVRWVGPFHPELRLEPGLTQALAGGTLPLEQIYGVCVFERGPHQKELVAARIRALGGAPRNVFPDGFRFEARLSPSQVVAVAALPEVAALDRWSPGGADMDLVREFGGANALEAKTGFKGQGVRGEVFDLGVQLSHPDFQHTGGVLLHGVNGSAIDWPHGTSTTGICFGNGSVEFAARGLLPSGKIVFGRSTDYLNGGAVNRYQETADLIDAGQPYKCVFQTNSTGSDLTFSYNSIAQMMDDVLFLNDLVVLQSQSNSGTTFSRPEAWAKNIVACGGIRHLDTLTKDDDFWSGASIGPAGDGRIKPDLAHFFDDVLTATSGSSTTQFAGTSASTPIVAGHFGLFFQMWHNDVWGNAPTGATVFASRPSSRLARAAIINSAQPWSFSGTDHNLGRMHQGWGAPDVEKLYNLRDRTFWIDETDVLDNLSSRSYTLHVDADEPALRVTLVYRDPKGAAFSGVQRINDLSLRVRAPSTKVFWGNSGLDAGNWSTSGGGEDHRNVVENVFVQHPAAGTWTVEVLGTDINTDVVPGKPGNNADFALWVTGVTAPCPSPATYCTGKTTSIGMMPAIGFTGAASQAANNLVITLANAVPNKTGLVFWGPSSASTPFQGGFLCVGGTTKRGPATVISVEGMATTAITITGAMVGSTQFYQWWFRDPAAPFTTGLSNALQVQFCP
jgi:hypothetical protein